MIPKTRIQAGTVVEPRELVTIHSERIRIPDRSQLVHLQFRRFAGCPVCNLHLYSIVRRYEDILAASIREVVVFHSTAAALCLTQAICRSPSLRIRTNASSPSSVSNPVPAPCSTRARGCRCFGACFAASARSFMGSNLSRP